MLLIFILSLLCILTSAQNNECSLNFSFNITNINCNDLHLNGEVIWSKSVPSGIIYLNIRNCTGDINERLFQNLGDLYLLSIEDSKLNTFVLPRLPLLNDLDIRNSLIPKMTRSTFKNVKNLKHITLEQNKMDIESGSFRDLNELLTLVIERQNITFNAKFLSGVKKLSWLNLADLGIGRIARDTFKDTKELLFLKLDNNPIENIEPGALDSLKKLKQLSVLKTQLQKLDMELFKELKSLEAFGAPARIFKNIDLAKLINYSPKILEFDFSIEDCGKTEIDNLINQARVLRELITIKFDGVIRPNYNC